RYGIIIDGRPRVTQRSQLSKSAADWKSMFSPGNAQSLPNLYARLFASGVSGGSIPLGGSKIRFVCRCGMFRSRPPERNAPVMLFSLISCFVGSTRLRYASIAALYSVSVSHFLFGSHGGAPGR